ncbi:hypothetical protein SAMN05421544_10450 [Riemerella columbipharyngis]|uniref:Uncharacterized protein n=2 Tax=Riemerella columbipharyngis TaxID=1071918 RepID=A0A1G7AQK8_9FLAO|nr:hypothetical protein SAMN05421544_10450 [Riemerella columbipharyngis]
MCNTKNVLPVAISFLFMPSLLFSQSAMQLSKIKKAANVKELSTLSKNIKSSTLNVKELKSKACSLNIPSSGVVGKSLSASGI